MTTIAGRGERKKDVYGCKVSTFYQEGVKYQLEVDYERLEMYIVIPRTATKKIVEKIQPNSQQIY